MSELDKLEQYLKDNQILYVRMDHDAEEPFFIDRHQIIVYDRNYARLWDAVCQQGSYGYEKGLLEVMGSPVVRWNDGDDVCGYLTADDVIERLEERR